MDSKKLLKVRPNLGNPLILAPQDLKYFEITVAYRVDQEDKSKVTVPSTATVREALSKNPPTLGWKSGGSSKNFNVKIYRVHSPFKHSAYWDDYGNVKHAETSAQQQYRNGFRWEMKVNIGITDDEIKQLKDTFRWPSLLNFAGHPHAIYVHEMIKNSDEFTIFHITDTHIARRNDTIPELLCQVRNKKESEQLAENYVNFNDNLRSFIKMANERWRAENGKVLVVLTGDIVDYYFDGWWDGKFVCGQGEHAKWRADEEAKKNGMGYWEYSNVGKFREIILGTDKKGEELLCPLFTIIGNHDYLMNEVLLNFDINLGPFKLKNRDTSAAFNLSHDEGREYDYWAFPRNGGEHKSIRERKNFKERINKDNWKASLDQDWSYWLAKPKSWQLSQYLCTLSYDLDFKLSIGNHQLLFLNTGNDKYPRQEEFVGLEDKEDEDKDYIDGGPHNRGITEEQIKLIENAMNNTSKGFIFVFSHAPLISLQNDKSEGIDALFEENHEKAPEPPNETSKLLSELYGKSIDNLKKSGFPLSGTKYFKRGYRDPELNFSCADGKSFSFLWNISRKSDLSTDKIIFVFSGHTHKVHEFRTELFRKKEGGPEFGFFIDDYTTKYLKAILKKSYQRLFRGIWLLGKSPFLFTSGGFKNKKPNFREIVIKNNGIDHMEMNELQDIKATASFSPGCRAIALRSYNGKYICAAGECGHELVTNQNQIKEWERFELCRLDNQQIALKAYNKQFVRAEGGGGGKVKADRTEIHSHELFKLHDLSGNKVALQTVSKGKYLCAEGGGREIVANRDRIGSWEKFDLIELDIL
jgi:hypothetical protein